jgi:dihydrodipicolinate synthase/N-acetylneuraminate lyase
LTEIGGIFPSLCNICSDSGEIDAPNQKQLVEFVIEKGVHGIAGVIGNGEYYKYSDEERKKLMRVIVDAANGKVPVYVGTSYPSTEPTLMLSKYAEDIGADGVIILPPFFETNRPSMSEIETHFQMISRSTDIPIMIQDAEVFGIPISPSMMAKIALSNEHIKSMKIEGSNQLERIAETKKLTGEKVRLVGGRAGLQLAAELKVGAHGSIPGCATPEMWVGVFNTFRKNGYDEALRIQDKWSRYVNFMTSHFESWTQLEKEVLKMRGIISSSYNRIPNNAVDQRWLPELGAILKSLELL